LAPYGVSAGTESEIVPFVKWLCRRAARADRWSLEAGEGGGVPKNVFSRRKGIVAAKSAGVVSDTNQGMSFGLHKEKYSERDQSN
jgi:hypothetical protein